MIVDLPMAPLAVLAFLGGALFVFVMLAVIVFNLAKRNTALSLKAAKILAGGIGLYAVVMLGDSAFSKDYVLRAGAEKHFCELDCHIAYSVTKVETPAGVPTDYSVSEEPQPGQLYVVTLRTRFDEATIGKDRGDALLTPNPRKILVRDEAGKWYTPQVSFSGPGIDQPLHPGGSYETRLYFKLPPVAKNPRLFLSNEPWPNSLLIGHENSPLHGKAYFDLKS